MLQHFGAEAPVVLNHYAIALEDALIRQAELSLQLQQQLREADLIIDAAAEEAIGMRRVMTNPDMLSAYVNEFFHPERGVVPVELPMDRLRRDVEAGIAESGMGVYSQAGRAGQAGFVRPVMDVTPPGADGRPADRMEMVRWAMRTRPQDAWKFIDQLTPDDMARTLIQVR